MGMAIGCGSAQWVLNKNLVVHTTSEFLFSGWNILFWAFFCNSQAAYHLSLIWTRLDTFLLIWMTAQDRRRGELFDWALYSLMFAFFDVLWACRSANLFPQNRDPGVQVVKTIPVNLHAFHMRLMRFDHFSWHVSCASISLDFLMHWEIFSFYPFCMASKTHDSFEDHPSHNYCGSHSHIPWLFDMQITNCPFSLKVW